MSAHKEGSETPRLQVTGKSDREPQILRAAAFLKALPWNERPPTA
jgi:hypothetical protein